MTKRKGFAFRLDREKILRYKDIPAHEKLQWLEDANNFCRKFVKGKKLKIWQKIKKGEL